LQEFNVRLTAFQLYFLDIIVLNGLIFWPEALFYMHCWSYSSINSCVRCFEQCLCYFWYCYNFCEL